MRFTHCSPWRSLFREFENLPDGAQLLVEDVYQPAVDVQDSKDNLLVRVDIPGVSREQIEVSVKDGALFIQGERKAEESTKEELFAVRERFYGSFTRAIALPAEVDANRVSASYKDGVLEVTLPKKEEAQPKKIAIN